jgi:hypothetical protein
LPCPDIKIGLRHPVDALSPSAARACVIHFTIGLKKSGSPFRSNNRNGGVLCGVVRDTSLAI